jgi:uncharacterized membrane protein
MSITTTGVRPMPALLTAAHPAAMVLTGVLAGAVLATWLSEASVGGSTELWIAYHQAVTPAYTRVVPPLGGLALIAALAALAASWPSPRDRRLILAAVACLVIGLVVTVVVHFPINAEIATWQPADPPADWQQFRDRWLAAHAVRTIFAVAGFALLVACCRQRRTEPV